MTEEQKWKQAKMALKLWCYETCNMVGTLASKRKHHLRLDWSQLVSYHKRSTRDRGRANAKNTHFTDVYAVFGLQCVRVQWAVLFVGPSAASDHVESARDCMKVFAMYVCLPIHLTSIWEHVRTKGIDTKRSTSIHQLPIHIGNFIADVC